MNETEVSVAPEVDAAATRIAEALGITPEELDAIVRELAADGQNRPAVELLALGEVVRRDPHRHDLVGAVEAGEILKVSRARVHQLAERPDFPTERYHLTAGKLWRRADIVAFDKRWDRRRTGRPPKAR
jgi:hypothetical protein